MLYIAYGSNLNKEQMKRRCPQAKPVGTIMLKNYELQFRIYLTIIPKQDSEVPVAIWEITERDEESLDLYEGYPKQYRKEYLDIEIQGRREKALVYIMNGPEIVKAPFARYVQVCLQGYHDFQLDKFYLMTALMETLQ